MSGRPLDEEAIFEAVCGLESADARNDYLQRVCGDNQPLLQRVVTLLRAHDEEPSFLESPPAVIAATLVLPPIAEHPGAQIGPYKLLEQIGEGGMGVVFVAVQAPPVERRWL